MTASPARAGAGARSPRAWVTAAGSSLVTLGGYVGFLAWDQAKGLGADGYQHGPYQPWQVWAVCVVVALAAAWAGLRRQPITGAFAATITMTVAWSVDAATDGEDDGLWPVGAFLVALATLAGFSLLAELTSAVVRSDKPRKDGGR
jgi:hypothetical protein